MTDSMPFPAFALVSYPWLVAMISPLAALRWKRYLPDLSVLISNLAAAVRDAMDIIDAGPHLPLTTSTLARQCHVSVRTLQEGFQRHLGISPMTYLRLVRLRRAHRDRRSADPCHNTVASIAHRWGFTHLGSAMSRRSGSALVRTRPGG